MKFITAQRRAAFSLFYSSFFLAQVTFINLLALPKLHSVWSLWADEFEEGTEADRRSYLHDTDTLRLLFIDTNGYCMTYYDKSRCDLIIS